MQSADAAACVRLIATAVAAGETVVVWCGVGLPRLAAAQAARNVSEVLVAAVASGGWRVSRSATDGLAAVAVSATRNVGVDVQQVGADSAAAGEVRSWLHLNEQSIYRPGLPPWRPAAIWSRKEAVLKALGVGLAVGPEAIDAGPWSIEWHRVRVPRFEPVRLRSIEPPCGPSTLAAAVAVAGDGDDEVKVRLTSWPR